MFPKKITAFVNLVVSGIGEKDSEDRETEFYQGDFIIFLLIK